MHMGMAGPAPGVNPFTVDEIQELMGLIPGEQQSAHHAASETHQRENSLDSSQPLNAVAVSSTTSSGLAQVLGGGAPHGRMGSPAAAPSAVPQTKEIDEGSKSQARSERKRSREKQRRTDVNKQFGELTEVLKRIEAEEQQLQQERAAREEARDGTVKQNGASRMILPPFSPTNRVDLIARTIAHLERLSHVTKKQLAELQSLEDQLKAAKKSGEDMAQKLKEVVFNQQQQGGMMMGNMMGGFNPMQMAMGGANPMAMATGAPNAMSVQPQKPQVSSFAQNCRINESNRLRIFAHAFFKFFIVDDDDGSHDDSTWGNYSKCRSWSRCYDAAGKPAFYDDATGLYAVPTSYSSTGTRFHQCSRRCAKFWSRSSWKSSSCTRQFAADAAKPAGYDDAAASDDDAIHATHDAADANDAAATTATTCHAAGTCPSTGSATGTCPHHTAATADDLSCSAAGTSAHPHHGSSSCGTSLVGGYGCRCAASDTGSTAAAGCPATADVSCGIWRLAGAHRWSQWAGRKLCLRSLE